MKYKSDTEYKKMLDCEIEKRIQQMETLHYPFPKRFEKKDYCIWSIVIAICLIAVVAGAFL